MKAKICFLFIMIISLATAGSAQSKKEIESQVRAKLESRDYTIDVDVVYPMGGRSIYLTSNYSLTVSKDRIDSYLPYFGRAYSIPYGGGSGLIFEADIVNYEIKTGKRGSAEITITTRNDEDQFNYLISIFNNGSASISVNSNNRQPISFKGELRLID